MGRDNILFASSSLIKVSVTGFHFSFLPVSIANRDYLDIVSSQKSLTHVTVSHMTYTDCPHNYTVAWRYRSGITHRR